MLSMESRSRKVTSAPIRSPSSWMACTLTLTRLGPSMVCQVGLRGDFTEIRRLPRAAHRATGDPDGKISFTRRPRKCSGGAPRNFSAAGLTMMARASRVNRSKPSSMPAMTEFIFSRRVLKISCTPRNCWPTCVILRLTCRVHPCPRQNPVTSGAGVSNCPAEMRSNCAEMSAQRRQRRPAHHRSQAVEITNASNTMVPNFRTLGEISASRSPEDTATRTSPNGWPLLVNGKSSS